MVGKAFDLGEDAFLRISSPVYASIQKNLAAQLKTLYKHVDTPVAAPWKADFASVYFVVAGPLKETARSSLKAALGAKLDNPATGNNPTSLFAIPASDAGKFYKIEVHECQSENELECTKFYLSYGDLGMILSVIARVHGFTFGTKGLKTHYGNPTDSKLSGYVLSDSPEQIIAFFGLKPEVWKRGFASQDEVFHWVASSRLFNASLIVAEDRKEAKKADQQFRQMYRAFIAHAAGQKQSAKAVNVDAIREDALRFFGKKASYDKQVEKNLYARACREKFNGTKVMGWTKLQGMSVRDVMNVVRERLGIDGVISKDEKSIRDEVLRAQTEVKKA